MKLVTLDYGCGTSSSILDYGDPRVEVVTENSWRRLLDTDDDYFLVGHDFLSFMWADEKSVRDWESRRGKQWLWCFERVDAIVPTWRAKSHASLSVAVKFCERVFACDESDCDRYGFEWLPQWASRRFYDERLKPVLDGRYLFCGQANKPEYAMRDSFLSAVVADESLSSSIAIVDSARRLSWDEYVSRSLSFGGCLNPIGVLQGLNTRAWEAIYAGRSLLQHRVGQYRRHQELLSSTPGVIFFDEASSLKGLSLSVKPLDSSLSFKKNSLYARMQLIGAWAT